MTFPSLQNHQYLNLETFRKSGVGVKTPVWFTSQGSDLYVWTQADSGKAKRIRNNGKVNLAPCKADGTLLGDWQSARATQDTSAEAKALVHQLMKQKYGLGYSFFRLLGWFRQADYAILRISPAPSGEG